MQRIRDFSSHVVARIRALPHLDMVALVGAMAAYAGLVLSHISTWSIWFDEAFTAYLVRFNYLDIAHYTATDVHPPLYYWVVKAWTSCFGTNELAFRSLSMVFGVVAIVVGFVLIKKLFGASAAVVGAWFMALSPMFIRYGEEARMYTMVTAIVLTATYVLVRATETNARKYWVWYGVLIALGMWTHYFAALAWLAHWVWRVLSLRYVERLKGRELRRKFFSKEWLWTHALAIGVFAAWAPFMLRQLGIIQMGFWIPAVSAHTFTNYFTNVLFYLEQQQVVSWLALLYMTIVVLVAVLLYRTLRSTRSKQERSSLLLLVSLAFAPPVILFIASMPPLKSSFVERYLIPASAALMLLLAVVIIKTWRNNSRRLSVILSILLVISFGIGINRVYYYGNSDRAKGTPAKDTAIRTKELIAAIDAKAQPGEPLIATDPWVFYEAVFYATKDHPIYFLDQTTEYKWGSTDMLKYNDQFKIKDIDSFTKNHPTLWYFGNHGVEPPSIVHGWQQVNSVTVIDPMSGTTTYQAAEFRTNAE